MALVDATIINQIASYERNIAGIKNSYDFAKNPDVLPSGALPAVVHYIPAFTSGDPRAHYLQFKSVQQVRSVLMVAPRLAKGATLKFLENDAIPFGNLWRTQFHNATIINAISSATGALRCFLSGGTYGAGRGDDDLSYGGVFYIGWIFNFEFSD